LRDNPSTNLVDPLEELLALTDVCRLLGISRATLYRLLEANELPSIKIGRRRVVEPRALRTFIARQRRQAVRAP
jgi:excisionase family DNA binding protein